MVDRRIARGRACRWWCRWWSSSGSVIVAVWLATSVALLDVVESAPEGGGPRRCQEITIPMCRGIGYNHTYMPNQFSHDSQEEAGLEVHQFWPLVEIQCSSDLRFLLCSMYAPICMTNYHKPLPACRSVCERAKSGCAPLMQQYGFAWPDRMRCSELPEYGDQHRLCMDFNNSSSSTTTRYRSLPTKPSWQSMRPDPSDDLEEIDHDDINCDDDCTCGGRGLVQIVNESSPYYHRIWTGGIPNCAVACRGIYFGDEEMKFAHFWIGLWSILCCVSTALTLLTFVVDMQRFKYPERSIILLSFCYFFISIGYIIRLVLGHDQIACDTIDATGTKIARYQTTGPVSCTIVFLLIYFFGMAASAWWVIMSFTWFLAAGLKWSQEAIASYSQYFHMIAWLLPSVKSIVVLAMSAVDGDPVSGVCSVGNLSLLNLRIFVLAPLCVFLLIGTSFLVAGFISLFRLRKLIKQQGQTRTDKLEKFMIRIGVVSVLYTVPALSVICCYSYEHHYRDAWERTKTCQCLAGEDRRSPDFSVFILKYFMSLIVGTTSGFWIWSRKTLHSWQTCFGRLCFSKGGTDVKSGTAVAAATKNGGGSDGSGLMGRRGKDAADTAPSPGDLSSMQFGGHQSKYSNYTPMSFNHDDTKSLSLLSHV